jgi:hypothetical protein
MGSLGVELGEAALSRSLVLLPLVMLLAACSGAPAGATPTAPTPSPSGSTGATASPAATGYAGTGWSSTALSLTERMGERFPFNCPADGRHGVVWGSDTYTADSSVCTAAVHAGLISLAGGGDVTIEMRPGQQAYQGSDRNGASTLSYGSYDASFVFVDGGTPTPTASQSGTYEQLLTHVPANIRHYCSEVDPTAAGALAVANCQPDEAFLVPGLAVGDVIYIWFADVGDAREHLQAEVVRHSNPLGEDCRVGPSQQANEVDGQRVGRLLCAEDIQFGGEVIAWWTDERLTIVGSVLLYEGTYDDLYNVVDVAQAQP